MRSIFLIIAVSVALFASSRSSAEDPSVKKYGTLHWEKDYPKVKPAPAAGIEVFGDYKFNPEWTIKEAKVVFTPKAGGNFSAPTELKVLGGKWGALDPKDKTKITPAFIPLGKGEWSVWVTMTLEGKDESGTAVQVPFLAMIKNVDVK